MEGRPGAVTAERSQWIQIYGLIGKPQSDSSDRACVGKHRSGSRRSFRGWNDDLECSNGPLRATGDLVSVSINCGCGSYVDRGFGTAAGFDKLQSEMRVPVKRGREMAFNLLPRMAAFFVFVCLLLQDTRLTSAAFTTGNVHIHPLIWISWFFNFLICYRVSSVSVMVYTSKTSIYLSFI